MGNQKRKWTAEEEAALCAGITKHGPGQWKHILRDTQFSQSLIHRSNIDLKDKWRNMNMNSSVAAEGLKEKLGGLKVKCITDAPPTNTQKPILVTSPAQHESAGTTVDHSKISQDGAGKIADDHTKFSDDGKKASTVVGDHSKFSGKMVPRYDPLIFEALSTINDANGSDIPAIVRCIEQKHEVPQNFRRLLGPKLRRLVSQGKLDKVQNRYKVKTDTVLGAKMPGPKQIDAPTPKQIDTPTPKQINLPTQKQINVRPRQIHNSPSPPYVTPDETVEAAATVAVYKIVAAENKSMIAAEAVKEAERVSRMAEDAESMLLLIKELTERCSQGEVLILA